MKKITLVISMFSFNSYLAMAQMPVAQVKTVIAAEESFNKAVARKGIKEGFLSVADPQGIVFKPDAKNIIEFYSAIDKQPGTLNWQPKFGRIAANGDLAFTAGPYVYQNGPGEDDKVYGDYLSVWKGDDQGKLRLLINLGIQHPEPETLVITDFKEPDSARHKVASKDPFSGKKVMLDYDRTFNYSLSKSVLGTYKEFMSPEGRFYFPGFEPITGVDKTSKFIDNEGIMISAETVSAGRATSNDLAYSYGTARIKKGEFVSNYNYVRIWEVDAKHNWNVLTEIFSAVEK